MDAKKPEKEPEQVCAAHRCGPPVAHPRVVRPQWAVSTGNVKWARPLQKMKNKTKKALKLLAIKQMALLTDAGAPGRRRLALRERRRGVIECTSFLVFGTHSVALFVMHLMHL